MLSFDLTRQVDKFPVRCYNKTVLMVRLSDHQTTSNFCPMEAQSLPDHHWHRGQK